MEITVRWLDGTETTQKLWSIAEYESVIQLMIIKKYREDFVDPSYAFVHDGDIIIRQEYFP